MKKFAINSIVLPIFLISLLLFQYSCKTVCIKSKLSKEQILVQKTWEVDMLHHVISGRYSEYMRGGLNTTGIDYENLRFKFNSDGTGTHIDSYGTTYDFTWQFTSADKRSLNLTINKHTDSWQMLEIAGNYLHASANFIIGGDTSNIETFRLVQVP